MTPERSDSKGVANRGLVRPPFVYLAAILIGLGLDLAWHRSWLPAGIGGWLAIPLVVLALLLFTAAAGRFKAAGTPVPGNQPATAIVRSGPYRFSRNPIYLADTMIVIAIGLIIGSVWFLLLALLAAVATTQLAIRGEERHLFERFGKRYRDYATRVRRWI